jgi:hypothetical protein
MSLDSMPEEKSYASPKDASSTSPNTKVSGPWKQSIQTFVFVSVVFTGVVLLYLVSVTQIDPYICLIFYAMVVYYAWCLFFQESEAEHKSGVYKKWASKF